MTEQKIYCGSCDQWSNKPQEDEYGGSCPHCGSGNWEYYTY